MKWVPSTCRAGDMIRIRIGSIWHYGIFVSEEEVIQFGLPPVAPRNDADVTVCASDIDAFCCGQIVEVAQLDKSERKNRIAAAETVRLARSRLGEGGYNLIHNNCEHFAYQCVFGIKKSQQEEDARKRWNSRPICDVYVAQIPENPMAEPVFSPERRKVLEGTRNQELLHQRHYAWKVLEYAAARSFSLRPEALSFRRNLFGRWSCDAFHFSISHTRGFVAVAVSNSPVGIDIENVADFKAKFQPGTDIFLAAAKKITAPQETCATPEALLDLWTKKESTFKAQQSGRFQPHKIRPDDSASAFCLALSEPVYLAVCSEKISRARYYLYENSTARLMPSECKRDEITL